MAKNRLENTLEAPTTEATNGSVGVAALDAPKPTKLTIKPPNFQEVRFRIRFNAPYVQNKFSAKAREAMRLKQEQGSTANKGRGNRAAKDFDEVYRNAMHISTEGWHGIPAAAFRNAMISACRMVGFKMTHAKLAVFVIADGYDRDDRTALVRIIKGEPHYHESYARNETGVCDVRPRPMWDTCEITLRVKYDGDQFSLLDVANLLNRAGYGGVGEGRPDSKESAGLGWGTFEIADDEPAILVGKE